MNPITIARFWSKVEKTKTCWNWVASKRFKGYGAFVWADNDGLVIQGRAHRFAWELANGKIPDGQCVLHKCDNPACVRIEHLFLGTKADNNADMVRKGRHVHGGTYVRGVEGKWKRGAEHHRAKLNDAIVRKLRLKRATGLSFSKLAAIFDINISSVHKIVMRKAWAHVT